MKVYRQKLGAGVPTPDWLRQEAELLDSYDVVATVKGSNGYPNQAPFWVASRDEGLIRACMARLGLDGTYYVRDYDFAGRPSTHACWMGRDREADYLILLDALEDGLVVAEGLAGSNEGKGGA